MPKFFYTHTKKIIAVILVVLIVIVLSILRSGDDSVDAPTDDARRSIATLSRGDNGFEARMSVSGTITSEQEAVIRSETTGTIIDVPARVGQSISQGAVIARFNTTDAQNAVAQARAARDIASASLSELERSAAGGDNATNIESQQNTLVQNAYRNLLNTDLRAYPAGRAEEERALPPTISGTYTSNEEGVYIVETYASGALSGASFRLRGLETATQSINAFNNAVPLGTRGLMISFPQTEGVSLANQEWVIEIPNTRSSLYGQALSAYEAAQSSRDVALSQGIAGSSRLDGARAQLAQAEAGLQAAQNQLQKATVRAPFSGDIINVNVRTGDFVSAGSPIATIVNSTDLYVRAYMSSQEARRIEVGNTARINDRYDGAVSHIASGINPQNGKVEVHISIEGTIESVSGEFVSVEIILEEAPSEEGGLLVPLSAVQPGLQGSVIYTIDDEGVVAAQTVEIGVLVGEYIEILSPLGDEIRIALFARGLRDGMVVDYE